MQKLIAIVFIMQIVRLIRIVERRDSQRLTRRLVFTASYRVYVRVLAAVFSLRFHS